MKLEVVNNLSSEPDLALAAACAGGDGAARRELARRLLDRVRATVHCLAAGDPEAEDYAQTAMIEILQATGSFRAESSLETWADRIAARTALRQIKRKRRQALRVVLDPEADAAQGGAGETELTRTRVNRRVGQLLGALKPKHRVALTLRLAFGYSVAEIADITDTPLNTVRNRLRRGRKLLHRKVSADPLLAEWLRDPEVAR